MQHQLAYLSFLSYLSARSVTIYIALLCTCVLLFFTYHLPIIWIVFGLVEVVAFFHFTVIFSKKWFLLPNINFQKKLFNLSLLIRVFYVIFSYFFYQSLTDQPFEIAAADSLGYHNEALWMLDLFANGNLDRYFNVWAISRISDIGWPFFLFTVYLLLGSFILIPRLIFAVISSWMCLLLYKLTQRSFDEKTARLAAIMAMLLPNFIYYTGLHLKETLMIFLLVAFFERADNLLRSNRVSLKSVGLVLFWAVSLFFFRTVLAISAIAAFSIRTIIDNKRIYSYKKYILGISLMLLCIVIYNSPLNQEVSKYINLKDKNLETQMQHFATRTDGNKYSTYGSKGLFLPMMFMAPFTTMVNTGQDDIMMRNGAMFTRNVYAYFVWVALILLIKRKRLKINSLILSFVFGYIFVLSSSGFALSERFHLPLLPFLLILAAYGITNVDLKIKNYFPFYLLFISMVIVLWNLFKLAGRGLI